MAPHGSGEDVVVDALRKQEFSVSLSRDPYDVIVQFLKNPVKLVVVRDDSDLAQSVFKVEPLGALFAAPSESKSDEPAPLAGPPPDASRALPPAWTVI